MDEYTEELVSEIKSLSYSDNVTDREAFFQIYSEKLEESEIIEDYHYLSFEGTGSRNRNIQIDGYAYSELDSKLTLFIIPPLAYYETVTLKQSDAEIFFNRAKYFYLDANRIISNAEESSEGYGLAFDIFNNKMEIKIVEINIFTDYIKSQRVDIISSTVENGVRFDYAIYDNIRMKAIDESASGREPLSIDLKKEFDCDGIFCLPSSKTKEYEAFLCNIPGVLLAQMYDKYQSRLLEGNVRSFLQTKGKVNKGIRNTILNDPDMFFAYNNGIAATVESLEFNKTEKGLAITSLKSLQIVNGGQTTASLANAWVNDKRNGSVESIKRIWVPMKISVVTHENGQELIPNISRFANSQNRVSDADLASNHPFHIKIEELSRRIVAPAIGGVQFGTYWYYERANGQYRQETYKSTPSFKKNFELRNPRNQMFKKVELAKYFNIYLKMPHVASAGAQKSFNKFSTWMIKEWDKDKNFVNDDFYRQTISLVILFRKTDKIVKTQVWYDSYKANIVAYTLSSIFNKIEKDYPDYAVDFNKIWKQQNLSNGWILQIQKVSKIMYDHLTSPNRTVENVTEWSKRETCWNQAKSIQYDFNPQFINDLISKSYVKTQEMSARKEEKSINALTATIDVFNFGADFWKDVYTWGMREKIWNVQDIDFLNLAMSIDSGKYPSDKQCVKILQTLEKARSESYPK